MLLALGEAPPNRVIQHGTGAAAATRFLILQQPQEAYHHPGPGILKPNAIRRRILIWMEMMMMMICCWTTFDFSSSSSFLQMKKIDLYIEEEMITTLFINKLKQDSTQVVCSDDLVVHIGTSWKFRWLLLYVFVNTGIPWHCQHALCDGCCLSRATAARLGEVASCQRHRCCSLHNRRLHCNCSGTGNR